MFLTINVATFWDPTLPNKVSIARSMPQGVDLPCLSDLMPSKELLFWWKNSDKSDATWAEYTQRYGAQIKAKFGNRANMTSYIQGMASECLESWRLEGEPEVTLCCWEKSSDPHCHRKLIYQWLPDCVKGECK